MTVLCLVFVVHLFIIVVVVLGKIVFIVLLLF